VPLPGPPVHHGERAGAGPGRRRGHRRPLQPRRLPGPCATGAKVGGEHGEAAPRGVGAIHGAAARDRVGRWEKGAADRAEGRGRGQEEQKWWLLGRFGFAQFDEFARLLTYHDLLLGVVRR